ncbi:amidohydrolase family protein [Novosphingobium sp. RL4]|uniref:amidohydrolase family protein n=1 Tax=Novosphingobium sp. RL4 TaxID=3109595 RepID=UPI002D7911B3|nr:amidohydrolase family protein [Novosphingobium sp. RL4]WRT95721.1 amidohydrolase family protein [Novosphingobium sp. RL4]
MMERLFTNALLPDGSAADLAVSGGRFIEISPRLPGERAAETIDLEGRLVVPGFVDGHIHLDKSFFGETWQPHRPAASLRERLAVEKAMLADVRPVTVRADVLIGQAASLGTVAMRSHVDVDATTGLSHLHAVMAAREKWRGHMDIELVAFPQAGILTCPGTADVLDAAIREGAEVIGGIDPLGMDGDSEGHLGVVFGIAERRGARIDIHLHEAGEGGIRQILRIAERTRALGMAGRVVISHAYALGDVPDDLVDSTARALADAGVAIMTNAPGDRAFPPILRLRAAGVRVFAGNDNIRDAWWPYGNGDMLQRAMLIGYRSGFHTDAHLEIALAMATTEAAAAIGREGHGLLPGARADFVAIRAPNAAAAVAAPPTERLVVRNGISSDPAAAI